MLPGLGADVCAGEGGGGSGSSSVAADAEREEYLLRVLLARTAKRLREAELQALRTRGAAETRLRPREADAAADDAAGAAAPLEQLAGKELENAVAALSGVQAVDQLPRLALAAPDKWRDVLQRCSCATAALLTSQWEGLEAQGHDLETFYTAVLDGPFGEDEARRARHALLDKKEAFSRQLLADRLAKLLE